MIRSGAKQKIKTKLLDATPLCGRFTLRSGPKWQLSACFQPLARLESIKCAAIPILLPAAEDTLRVSVVSCPAPAVRSGAVGEKSVRADEE